MLSKPQLLLHSHQDNNDTHCINKLASTYSYWCLKSEIRRRVALPSTSIEQVSYIISQDLAKPGGLSQLISNYSSIQSSKPNAILSGQILSKESAFNRAHLDAFSQNQFEIQVRGAKWDMDMIIKRRLERMTRDNRVPLVDRRRKNDEDTFYIKAVGKTDVCLSTGLEYSRSIEFRKNVEVLTGLYSADDIFEAIRSLQPITPRHTGKSQNTDDGLKTSSGGLFSTFWSTCHIAYQALTVEEFRHEFKELCPNFLHVGVDDLDDDTFATKTSQAANRILSSKSISEAHCFSKQGIPGHCRADMWDLMIQSDFTIDSRQNALEHCCFLKAQVARYELLTDHMIISDSEDCKADDNYFVFEDLVQDILLLWSRDEWHLKNSPNAHPTFFDAWIETEIKNKMKGKWSLPVKSYPPNGIFPFSGISSYAMLVTFIRAELETAYMMFRELYAKYFFKLHTISTYSDGIMTLAVTFESFLKQLDPLLFLHLTHEIGCPPITYAFRWLMFGFVGVLDVEQVLLLWDRILGFDRMEILSAVGASIFLFRKERLMEAKTEKDVERALMDLAMIKVIPLLQHYFFIHNTKFDCLPKQWKAFTCQLGDDDDREFD